jgi:hypothetical protein
MRRMARARSVLAGRALGKHFRGNSHKQSAARPNSSLTARLAEPAGVEQFGRARMDRMGFPRPNRHLQLCSTFRPLDRPKRVSVVRVYEISGQALFGHRPTVTSYGGASEREFQAFFIAFLALNGPL